VQAWNHPRSERNLLRIGGSVQSIVFFAEIREILKREIYGGDKQGLLPSMNSMKIKEATARKSSKKEEVVICTICFLDRVSTQIGSRPVGFGHAMRCANLKLPSISRDGGTGRRSGLKIRRPSGLGGSTPPPGTKFQSSEICHVQMRREAEDRATCLQTCSLLRYS
jgi:hypothetical protein